MATGDRAEPTVPPPTARLVTLVDTPADGVRRAGDLLAVAGCLLGIVVVILLVMHGRGTTEAVTRDVQAAARQAAPTLLQLPFALFGGFVMALVPPVVLLELAVRRFWRSLVAAVVAAVVGLALAEVVGLALEQFTPALHTALIWGRAVSGPSSWGVDPEVTGVVALLAATGSTSRSRVVRTGRALLAGMLVLTIIEGEAPLTGVLFAVLLGVAVGRGTRFATGGYVNRSTGTDLVRAILRSGVDATQVIRVDPPPRGRPVAAATVTTYAGVGYAEYPRDAGAPRDELVRSRGIPSGVSQPSTPTLTSSLYRRYDVLDAAGTHIDAVVLDADRQVVGLLQAAWDRLRLTGGVRRPVASVDQAADRLALLTLAARDAGVRTPALRGMARSRDSVVLVFERVERARSFTASLGVAGAPVPTQVLDAEVDDLWAQLRAAHAAGVAHLDLSGETVQVDGGGRVWFTGWFEGQVGSSELSRRIDMVQVLVLTAIMFGPKRAMAAAERNLTEEQLAQVAPLLQPPVLPGPTRRAADDVKGLLRELRERLVGLVPAADVEPIQLTRFSMMSVITATVLVGAVWTVLTTMNITEISAAISGASPWWVLVAFGVQLLSYWGGAVTLAAYTPERIGVWNATEVHLASSVVDLVAPAAIGSASVNLRFLNRRGISTPLGVATVTLVQISQIVTTVVMLAMLALGTGFALPSARPTRGVVLAVGVVLLALAGAATVPAVRTWIAAKVGPAIDQARPRLTWLLSNPRRMAAGVAGNIVMTVSYVGAFAASVAAFGVSLPLSTLTITYLASNSAGSVIPTPGGIGPVEAALTGGLTVAGVSPALALSIALVFRFVTFWVNIPIGWLYLRRLQRRNLL